MFKLFKDKRKYTILDISISRDYLCLLGICTENEVLSEINLKNSEQSEKEEEQIKIN